MRYLFGDSTPFPLTFDFLATLEAFMACGGDVVRLDTESKEQEKRVHADADARARSVESLERFHQTVLRAMRDSSMKSLDREVLDYATAVSDSATRYVEDTRRVAVAKTEREVAQLAVDVQRRREDAQAALSGSSSKRRCRCSRRASRCNCMAAAQRTRFTRSRSSKRTLWASSPRSSLIPAPSPSGVTRAAPATSRRTLSSSSGPSAVGSTRTCNATS